MSLSAMQQELVELDTAERVFARLSGAERHTAGPADEPKPQEAPQSDAPRVRLPSMPNMILSVMQDSYRQGLKGLSPKEMGERIGEKFSHSPRGDAVSSIAWRMWKRGQLRKDEDSPLYSLPEKGDIFQ